MNTNTRTNMVPQDLSKTTATANIEDGKIKKICHFTDKPLPEARC